MKGPEILVTLLLLFFFPDSNPKVSKMNQGEGGEEQCGETVKIQSWPLSH